MALHHLAPNGGSNDRSVSRPVLLIHGATFPTACAAGWRIDGLSWMDDLAGAGCDTYGLDFIGFGASASAPGDPGVGGSETASPDGADDLSRQIELAVRHIQARHDGARVHVVAHSAGTFAAGRCAVRLPAQVASLTLFGAPVAGEPVAGLETPGPAWRLLTIAEQFEAFEARVRGSGQLDRAMFESWGRAYLAADPLAATRDPPAVRVPAAMMAEVRRVLRLGQRPYDPARIAARTLVIQGAWDEVAPPERGLRLFGQLGCADKRYVVLGRAGHRAHLERERGRLFEEVREFLAG